MDAPAAAHRPPTPPPGSPAGPPAALRTAARWSGALLLIGGLVAATLAVAWLLRSAVVPVLVAALVTALLEPVDRGLRRRGLRPGAAAAITCVVLVAVIDGALWMLVTLLSDAAGSIAASLSAAAAKTAGDGPVARAVHGAADGLTELGASLAQAAAKGVATGVGVAAELLAGSILVLALVFFLLRDRAHVPGAVRRTVPGGRGDFLVGMIRRAYQAMAGFMRGTTLIAAIDALFISLGLLLLGVPHAFGLGALVFIGAYVPYVGAFLTGCVAVLVAFADGGLGLALGALAIVIAVQVIEGAVLQPVVQSRTVSLHPALVMLAVITGASLAGLFGALVAVPLTAAAVGIARQLRDDRARTRPEPVDG